jgi:lambda family phage portal protein
MATTQGWFDRMATTVAPRWQLKRVRARLATELMVRNYEGAGSGRRTQGWRRTSADSNQSTGPYLQRLRDVARDLVRNNAFAESALGTIVDHTVGWGIVAKPKQKNKRAADLWAKWAESTACDADGRNDFAGIQKLVMRTVVESGECLIRRRFRRPEDGLPLPMQIQVLEPDFLDTSKDNVGSLAGGVGNRVIQGVEFDAIGRRVAYWLYPEHPGSAFATTVSVRVPAANVQHVFRPMRPGQVRGVSWFAPVLLRFKDLDEFEDATLMKQKIAACLAVITSDIDGTAPALGTTDTSMDPQIDSLEPGMIMNVPPGRSIEVVQPPTTGDYAEYTGSHHRAIAAGLGVSYEDLTGDYTEMPFSAARMSRIRHWSRVEDWRWRMMVPQFCDPVWGWVMEVAGIFGVSDQPHAEWTAPPAPMIDPVNEGLAYQRNIRSGIQTLSEALRERGYDPEAVLAEMAADNDRIDALGLILDSDPRKMTQAGQLQGDGLPKPEATMADEFEQAARALRLAGSIR